MEKLRQLEEYFMEGKINFSRFKEKFKSIIDEGTLEHLKLVEIQAYC